MSAGADGRLIGLLRRVMRDTEALYRRSARDMTRRYPTLLEKSGKGGLVDQFPELMDDLHRGLLIKVYVTVVRADERWSRAEKRVVAEMIAYLWGHQLQGDELRDAATELFRQADRLTWSSLVAPFVRYRPLADAKAQLGTIVMRLANLVAKCDGQTIPEESDALHALQRDIEEAMNPKDSLTVLEPHSIAGALSPGSRGRAHRSGSSDSMTPASPLRRGRINQQPAASEGANESEDAKEADIAGETSSPLQRERQLERATAELEQLIGLESVKKRVRSYTNFLKLQTQRRSAGLSTMPISLHMTFVGNPGTGKTTVARIVGQILGAMGTLEKGHVVETDRAGLVAEYAGQTATKTNQICDSAIGGVLFIDEAYSLVDASGDDAYGREALQTLLKRMEDDRDRLAVILAGYQDEMRTLIRTNPGLSSRVNTTIEFEDYDPAQLGEIFGFLCNANQYRLPAAARHRLIIGLTELHSRRDRHFGNGRLVRNAFEDSVRRLADRVANVAELTEPLLTTLTAADIGVPELSSAELDHLIAQPHRLARQCLGCRSRIGIAPESLGRRVRCPSCGETQSAAWANVVHDK
ncbi:MAG: AAA family ATPase [Planctomycetota bacterium]